MSGVFREDLCTCCGECFTRCQYMDLSRREAVLEISRLIEGKPTRHVMQKCVSCYACDAFCPENANPYDLILSRWSGRYSERGLPVRASYLLPYHQPNYRTDMVPEMDPEEQEMLEHWQNTAPQGEFMYPGCNLMTLPALTRVSALAGLPVAGDWSLCCGEPFYRMGAFEIVEKIARSLDRYYRGRDIKKVVFPCPACMNMFRNVLPRFGAGFEFECEYLAVWLLKRMDAGELSISRKLDRTVTVHDSCHARVLGDEIMETTRELYQRLGLRVINPKHHHEDGICCGIAAGCNRMMPHDIVKVSLRELKEGSATGASEMAVYCGGCYLVMNMSRRFYPGAPRLVHTLELLAEALGEPVFRKVETRSGKILSNVVKKAVPKMLVPSRYKLEEPEVKKPETG
ncbi:MAG: (Fe-S)-binding protein [bacterium]